MLSGLLLVALATVAIEVPPDADENARERVVTSCESVLGAGRCVPAPSGAPAKWIATVAWDNRRLTVTLREPDREQEAFVARTQLDFSPQDEDEERWVASGLMVAALAAAQPKSVNARPEKSAPEPEPEPEPAAPPPPKSSPPLPERSDRRAVVTLDAGGVTGAGLDRGGLRWGTQGRILLLWGSPGVGVVSTVRGAWRLGEPTMRWFDGSVGLVVRPTGHAAVRLDLTVEGVVQSARASATQDGVTRGQGAQRSGGRGGAAVSGRFSPGVGWWLGGDVTVLQPELEVRLQSEIVGREPRTRWAVGSGLRFDLTRKSTIGSAPL